MKIFKNLESILLKKILKSKNELSKIIKIVYLCNYMVNYIHLENAKYVFENTIAKYYI